MDKIKSLFIKNDDASADDTNEISSKKEKGKSVSVGFKTSFLSKLDGLKPDVLFKGITKRWATNTLLITALILLVLVTACVLFFTSYYRNYVVNYLSGYANETVITYFTPYVDGDADVFRQKAKEFTDSFTDKSHIEVQVIDKSGKVLVSSSGFESDEEIKTMGDVRDAQKTTTGVCKWFGYNRNGEHIASVAMLLPQSKTGEFSGAVRFMTSMKGIDMQVLGFSFILLAVYLVAIFFVALSGVFFVQTIVAPLQKINETAKLIAKGNYDVRIETGNKNEDEISDLADSINTMINEVAVGDKMKNDFISTVSHELRTPLTAIKGWGEMLKELDGEDREISRRGTEVIINESERLSHLVEELLDFSRMQSGNLTLRLEKIDVLAELDEAVFVFKERSKRDSIEINYNAPEIPAPMMGDPNRIKQVFVNILDNAFKYNKQGGLVNVNADVDDGVLTINFSDTGCGIAPDDLPNVKKKFYKANIQVRGSGIGLAVVDEIVKLHNGEFEINSELNVGTTVTIVLPIEKVQVEPVTSLIEEMRVTENEKQ
ncbi:MAG: HAMP domain-containing histidine kinase [Clostridia bacterium]|nr:HAMP domain-containing histidine kinase [Clostridia bacterium]